MKELVSGTKFPTSCGSGVAVALLGGMADCVELVGGLAVELVGVFVLVLLLDCASAPRTVKDRLTTSKSKNRLFLVVNKLLLLKTNTHNLYDSY